MVFNSKFESGTNGKYKSDTNRNDAIMDLRGQRPLYMLY